LKKDDANEVLSVYPDGLDLFVKRTPLNIADIILALTLLKEKGHLCLKLEEIYDEYMFDLIYLIGMAFDETYLIKPISTRPNKEEKYLVCRLKRNNTLEIINILKQINSNVSKIFKDRTPFFDKWIREISEESLDGQIEAGENINKLLKGKSIDLPKYNVYACNIFWNIPDISQKIIK
jgi:hypothetical protein